MIPNRPPEDLPEEKEDDIEDGVAAARKEAAEGDADDVKIRTEPGVEGEGVAVSPLLLMRRESDPPLPLIPPTLKTLLLPSIALTLSATLAESCPCSMEVMFEPSPLQGKSLIQSDK